MCNVWCYLDDVLIDSALTVELVHGQAFEPRRQEEHTRFASHTPGRKCMEEM